LISFGQGLLIRCKRHLPDSVEVDMGWIDSFRHAEQQAAKSARSGAEFARKGIQAAEASVMRRVKAHRKPANANPPVSAHADPEQPAEPSSKAKARTGIVSVNGQDVGEMRCTGR
jgi:hypothetical protein